MLGKKIFCKMFGLDWRSLALMRMFLAFIILIDLAIGAQHFTAFYTDHGVLPRRELITQTNTAFSLYLLSGSWWWAAFLFSLEAVCALMMLAGYRTKTATVLCWLLLVSRQARNPLLTFGADIVLRIAMFWAMFLPLNRRYSLDVLLGRVDPPNQPTYCGAASVGAIIQFILVYVISGLLKSDPVWWIDHSAVYYALSIDIYSRPFGHWLNQFSDVTSVLTIYTLYLEIYGPVLLILPVGTSWGRLLAFFLFSTLQIGFAVCMQMGLLWIVMIAFNIMLLPAEFWTVFAYPAGRFLSKIAHLHFHAPVRVAQSPSESKNSMGNRKGWRHFLFQLVLRPTREIALLGLTVIIVFYNIDTIPHHKAWLPESLRTFVDNIGLDQYFNMFAPAPQTEDGWYVFRAWLVNGKNVDLRTGLAANFTKPDSVADTYGDERSASLLIDLTFSEYSAFRENFLNYMADQWNQVHKADEQIKTLEMIFMEQINGPNHVKSPPLPQVLWTEYYNQ